MNEIFNNEPKKQVAKQEAAKPVETSTNKRSTTTTTTTTTERTNPVKAGANIAAGNQNKAEKILGTTNKQSISCFNDILLVLLLSVLVKYGLDILNN